MAAGGRASSLLLLLLFSAAAAAFLHCSATGTGTATASSSDLESLLAFKASADANGQKLATWSGASGAECGGSWYGVSCDGEGRVSRLVVEGLGLEGGIETLARLPKLRRLSLYNNSLNGTIPDLSNWPLLRSLYLSRNSFSGPITLSLSPSLPWRLVRLDLSDNLLSGAIPASLARLPMLLTLRLQNNRLSGPIPSSLSNFSASSFLPNPGLCGSPLPIPCPSSSSSSSPAAAPLHYPSSGGGGGAAVVSSTASTDPIGAASAAPPKRNPVRLGTGALVAIVVGDVAVVLLISFVSVLYFRRCGAGAAADPKDDGDSKKRKLKKEPAEQQLRAFDCVNYSQRRVEAAAERGKQLVFMDGRKQFELENLLRASAEMLGKGTFGTTYRAVLDNGAAAVVAVKRLKDWSSGGGSRREFEQHLEIIGRFRHLNVVPLRAYYYAQDEKLLVYDYMQCGNLYTLLHGNRGPGRTPLDWASRVNIALGVAKGLAAVHHHLRPHKLAHGNLKSTNVLLDMDGNACISDVGVASMADPSSLATKLVGYRAPELINTKRLSQKGDVYSFGVLLLEILTGRAPANSLYVRDGMDLPKWVQSVVQEEWTAEVFDLELLRYKNIEEEMVAMLQIAMQCACEAPEQRPRMSQVVRMMEGVAAACSPSVAGDVSSDAVSMSPSVVSDMTAGGGGAAPPPL